MRTPSLLTSFLISFIITLTSFVANSHANPNATVTHEIIHGVYSHLKEPSSCLETLTPLIGKPLHPNPLAVLGTQSLDKATNLARETLSTIISLHGNISAGTQRESQLKLKQRYYFCHVKYSDIRTKITYAKLAMKDEKRESVRKDIFDAKEQAKACMKEFGNWPAEPSHVPQEVQALKYILKIVVAICDEVAHLDM